MLKPLIINKTKSTPKVVLDKEKEIFQIEGNLLPENSFAFFEPIFDWFRKYALEPNSNTNLKLSFDIINTSSTRRIITLLRILEKIVDNGNSVNVNFLFMPEDELMEYMAYEIANAFPSISFVTKTR
jgi:hypothetical protein